MVSRFFFYWLQGKKRIVFAWLFALSLAFFSQEFPHWLGITVCFLGASLRVWASGYLHKDRQLTVSGPYAWVRNPLYLGTYLMGIGALASTQAWIALAGLTLVFAGVYHFIILQEEQKLQKLFGPSYELYCRSVPRFFPHWKGPAADFRLQTIQFSTFQERYSWDVSFKNKSYEAYLSFIGLIGFSALCAFLKHQDWMSYFSS